MHKRESRIGALPKEYMKSAGSNPLGLSGLDASGCPEELAHIHEAIAAEPQPRALSHSTPPRRRVAV